MNGTPVKEGLENETSENGMGHSKDEILAKIKTIS